MLRMLTLIIIAAVAVPALSACVYSAIYENRVEETYPPRGDFVDVRGHDIHLVEHTTANAPTTVVLLHGASANAREFDSNLVPALSQNVSLIALDRPGHGHSERPGKSHDLGVQAEIIAKAIRTKTTEPVVLVGHSFGGAVSLRLALDHPDLVKGLVLLAPASHPWNGDTTWYNRAVANPVYGWLFSQLIPVVGPSAASGGMDNVFKPNPIPDDYATTTGLPLLFRPKTFRANGKDMSAANDQFAEQAKRYSDLTLPIIIFSPSEDHVLSPKLHAYALSKQAQHVDLRILENTGHMPHHTHTNEIADAIVSLATGESGQ